MEVDKRDKQRSGGLAGSGTLGWQSFWKGSQQEKELLGGAIPSGYVKIAIENGNL